MPGDTSSTTNQNVATFNNAGNGNTTITVDANRNLRTITFDTASVAAYTFTGGNFNLSNNSLVQLTATAVNTQTFNNAFTFVGPNAVFTNASTAGGSFALNGNISTSSASNVSLSFNGGGTTQSQIASVISDGPSSTIAVGVGGGGAWRFSGASNYSGATTVSGGTVTFAGSNAGASNYSFSGGTIVLENATNGGLGTLGTLTLNGASLQALSGNRTLSNTVYMTGNWTNSGPNNITFQGDYILNSTATRLIGSSGGGSTILNNVFLNAATSTQDSTFRLGNATQNVLRQGNIIVNGPIVDTQAGGTYKGAITTYADVNGVYSITLAGNNTFSNGLSHYTGTLNLNNAGALGTGTFTWEGVAANNSRIDNTTGAAIVNANNNNTVLATANGTYRYGGTQDLDLGTGTVSFSASTGTTIAMEGTSKTLTTGTWTNTGSGAAVLNVTNSGSGSGNKLVMRQYNLSNNNTGKNGTLGGDADIDVGIVADGGTGAGALTITNTATVRLTGASTYTGATTVSAGTLLVNGSTSASSAVSVASGATLGGSGLAAGAVSIATGGTLAPGSAGIGTFATGDLSMASGSTFALQLNTAGNSADRLNAGAINLDLANDVILTLTDIGVSTPVGSTYTLATYSSWNGGLFTYLGSVLVDDAIFTLGSNTFKFSYNGVDGLTNAFTLQAVPEPSSAMLLLGSLGVLAAVRRRSRR